MHFTHFSKQIENDARLQWAKISKTVPFWLDGNISDVPGARLGSGFRFSSQTESIHIIDPGCWAASL